MTKGEITKRLKAIETFLRGDEDYNKNFPKNCNFTALELCDWIAKNKPEIIEMLREIPLVDMQKHSFVAAWLFSKFLR